MSPTIKVLIVDDSAVVRDVMSTLLSSDRSISVIAAVPDPLFAMKRMEIEWPDVIVLDVEMPRMDGLTFLRKLMSERPTPVVICSSLTTQGADATMQALSSGAVSIVAKPQSSLKQRLLAEADDLISVVKAAARSKVRPILPPAQSISAPQKLTADAVLPGNAPRPVYRTTDRVIAVGASTGGTQAIEYLLQSLSVETAGIVIVQHMPPNFTAAFAKRLNDICAIEVREAKTGDRVRSGLALIAPGGMHMVMERSGAQYHVSVIDGPAVSRHKPSVDVLFRSTARSAGRNAVGLIMTGMGDDGARGLKEMRDAGATTLGQDEKSCVVYGMPKEAMKLGGVQKELPLDALPGALQTI